MNTKNTKANTVTAHFGDDTTFQDFIKELESRYPNRPISRSGVAKYIINSALNDTVTRTDLLKLADENLITEALETSDTKTAAARSLGISLRTLNRRMATVMA